MEPSEDNEEDSEEKNEDDLVMTEENVSKYLIALEDVIVDLDIQKGIKCQMFDKSVLINETLAIEATFVTVAGNKFRLYLACTEPKFTGILVWNPLPGQIDWMEKKLKESVSNLDRLLLEFYFCNGTSVGLFSCGCFVPYKIMC